MGKEVSEHNSILLVNRRNQRLRYERGSDVVFLDAERIILRSRTQQEILWLLVKNFGRVVPHNEICETLDKVGYGQSDELPNTRSAKFVAILRSELERISDLRDFIKTVRAKGYTIDENWTKPADLIRIEQSNDFLSMLDSIILECIEHATNSKIVTCRNGLQYIDFDSDFAIQKFTILNQMLWDTIRSLSLTVNASEIIAVKNTFYDLASYILFWRLGDELSEQKWKSDYRNEITTLARTLRRQVDELIKIPK